MKGVGIPRQGIPFRAMFHPCHQPLGCIKRSSALQIMLKGMTEDLIYMRC
jgi:hypothetical protein